MAIIDNDNPVTAESTRKFWEDELKNTRILLNALDIAIHKLTNDEITAYTMNTGANTVTVTRHNLPGLIDRRRMLIRQIEELENKLGLNPQPVSFQGVPSW